ncbi:S-layer homology domain-containing protein, partial [Paenibacillus mendelii]
VPVNGITLYAKWMINTYTVTFKDWDNTTLKSETVNHGSGATAPANPARAGYTFTGWDVGFANITSALTVTAQYEANEYTVSFDSTGGSVVEAIAADYGTQILAPAAPTQIGYAFAGWYKEAALANEWNFSADTVPVNGITLYAKWTAVYHVTYNGNGSTGGSVPIDSMEYESGDVVTVIGNTHSLTRSGFSFAGWNTQSDGNGTNYAASDILGISNTNVTLYARWNIVPFMPAITNPTVTESNSTGVDVLVNGKVERLGTANTTKVNGQTVTTITLNQGKLEERLKNEGRGAVITIPFTANSDVVIGKLNGLMLNSLEKGLATVVLQTENGSYTLPAQQINIQAIAAQFGANTDLQDISVQIEIAASTMETMKIVEYSASNGNFTVIVPPLNFTVTATYGDRSMEVSGYNAYVQRSVVIPDGVDPNKITTGLVVEQDGAARHVPTKVEFHESKYYAQLNSLTNSTYAVVWHPLEFTDVAQHWAKAAVNDMGSRMIISGIGDNLFNPNQDITRAEFAAIVIRGLGLKLGSGPAIFADVKSSDWYSDAIQTAYSYGLITGYGDGTFRPLDKITREQAMLIIAKAMKITGLQMKLTEASIETFLNPLVDASDVSEWAKRSVADSIQSGIVSGRNNTRLAPKANMTRAEVAVIIQKLLQKSDLI